MTFAPVTKIEGSDSNWLISCIYCGVEVGTLPHEEIPAFLDYLTRSQDTVLCFYCERDYQINKGVMITNRPGNPNDAPLV